MRKQTKGEKNSLTLVGLELVTPSQEARVITNTPPVFRVGDVIEPR